MSCGCGVGLGECPYRRKSNYIAESFRKNTILERRARHSRGVRRPKSEASEQGLFIADPGISRPLNVWHSCNCPAALSQDHHIMLVRPRGFRYLLKTKYLIRDVNAKSGFQGLENAGRRQAFQRKRQRCCGACQKFRPALQPSRPHLYRASRVHLLIIVLHTVRTKGFRPRRVDVLGEDYEKIA